MPILHDKDKLEALLKEHNIPLSDAVKRGEFYREYFDWEYLSNLYVQGKSIRDLSKITNLSYDVIRSNLKRILGELRDFTVKGNSKYHFDETVFYPEVTEYGAYLLGWLYSDGSITESRFNIVLQKGDYNHLSYIASLYSDKEVTEKKVGVEFSYFSVDLCRRIIKDFNVLPNKSHINFRIPIEKFNSKTFPYLLLGLFEGDGSIARDTCECSLLICSNAWNEIYCVLKDLIDVSHIDIKEVNEYGLLNVHFRGKSYFSFLEYLYTHTSLVEPLERKLDRFINQLQRSMRGKTSPYKKLAVNTWDNLIHNTQLV